MACDIGPLNPVDNKDVQVEKFQAQKWLIERLGKANTQRRQLLAYFKNHHDKITKYVDAPALQPLVGIRTDQDEHHDMDSEALEKFDLMSVHQAPTLNMSMRSQTTVTTVHNVSRPIDNLATAEVMSEGGQSETSFGTNMSWNEGMDSKLEVPPPPGMDESRKSVSSTPILLPALQFYLCRSRKARKALEYASSGSTFSGLHHY